MATFTWPGASAGSGSNASVGTNGATAPTSSTEVAGINPGGNLQPLQTDASGNLLVNLNAETGAPLHVIVDSSALPTGAATSALQSTGNTSVASIDTKTPTVGQKAMAASVPVVIASDQSAVPVSAASLPLPSGAATSALQTTGNTSLASIDTKTPALGSAAMAASVPVTLATDMLPIANVSILNTAITNANYDITCAGFTTVTIQSIGGFSTATFTIKGSTDGTNFVNVSAFNLVNQGTGAIFTNVSIFLVIPVGGFKVLRCVAASVTGGPPNLQMIAANGANLTNVFCPSAAQFLTTANIKDSLGNNLLQGQQTMANSLGVTIASNQSAVATAETTSGTGTITSVAGSASTVSLLASNASRKGATFFNESTAILYLKLAATASLTSYTVQIPASGYYELPFGKIYTGAIDGIWSAANGNVRITELT